MRKEDIAGRVGRTTLAIALAETDVHGATRLAQRLIGAVTRISDGKIPLRVHAGCAVDEALAEPNAQPVDVLTRATTALRRAQEQNSGVESV